MTKYCTLLFTLLLFLIFSCLLFVSINQKQQQVIKQRITEIEKQVALDLPLLDLSNTFLKHSGNKTTINNYIKKLNNELMAEEVSVEHIVSQSELSIELMPNQRIRYLRTAHGQVLLVFNIKHKTMTLSYLGSCIVLLILSVGMSGWLKLILINNNYIKKRIKLGGQLIEKKAFILNISLNTKTLSSTHSPNKLVPLANKPLCFYLALVEFCTENKNIALNQNKNAPEELVMLANKYFHRLVELGHTVRKRPNFNSSLEKTLSEIRAALDEALNEHPQQKNIYYPPKAFGEGSRSKLHSYALINIHKGNVIVEGK